MILMGGPIDPAANPTEVNRFAEAHSLEWFERTVITTVPGRYPGAFRRVYPGFLQLAGFSSMNLERHVSAHWGMFENLVRGDGDSAAATRAFYEEYSSVMDLPADFYLHTIKRVFHDHDLSRGRFQVRGEPVEPAAIEHTALMTVEGERDDVCGPGQTVAAHRLCSRIIPAKKTHHLQLQVGHLRGVPWPPVADRDLPQSPRVHSGAQLEARACADSSNRRQKDAPPGSPKLRPLWWRDQDGRNKMPLRGKVVITCAVTGSIHTPTMSPYLPLTPDEIARDAIAAAEAGAAILHLHARDPKDGRPTPDPDVFMQFLPRIKQATDAVVNITTGGGHGMSLEERLAAPLRAQARDVLAQHGLDEFRALPAAREVQGVRNTLGRRGISR